MQKRSFILFTLAAALLLVVMAAYLSFDRNLTIHMEENVAMRLHEIVEPNVTAFEMQMKEQMKKVNTFADYLGATGALGDADDVALLQAAVDNNGLLRCAIAFPDGSFLTHDSKNEGSVAGNEFFIANMRGECYISDPRPAVVDASMRVILFSAPIFRDDKVIGSVVYSYLCDDLNNIFNLSFMDGNGKILIMKQAGEHLIGQMPVPGVEGNVLEALRAQCTHVAHTDGDCISIQGNTGSDVITLAGGDSLLVHYERLAYNDWYMLSFIPESMAVRTISTVTQDQRNLGVIIAACIAVYSMVALVFWVLKFHNVDKLTGALTLESFKRAAKKILHQSEHNFVFVKLDVKNFKLINRVYNFTEGDRVIKSIATALRLVLSEPGMCFARVGTDDFLLLIPYHGREKLAQQRAAFISKFHELMGPQFTMAVEFPTGQYLLTESDFPRPDIPEILEKVNFAHRAAKQYGYTAIVDYVENLERVAIFEKTIENRMEAALKNGEFQMYLQPKRCVQTERLCGAEALVRWVVNGEFYLQPSDFIPVLERNGFVVKLDFYMFKCAAKKIRAQIDAGETPVPISVNFARCHLGNENFVEELCTAANQYMAPHQYLEIELTETAAFERVDRMVELISSLHAAGFTISMDDFGTGFSSLSLLKDLEVDALKIDRSFFDGAAKPNRARIVLANMLNMAKQLGVQTVAEGVEVYEQVEMLRALGCDLIQGFYYSRPVPTDSFLLSEEFPAKTGLPV